MDAKLKADIFSLGKVLVPTVVGALLGWLLGIFQDPVRRLVFGPNLRMDFEMKEPYLALQTHVVEGIRDHIPLPHFYIRIGVRNVGKSAATKLRILLTALEQWDNTNNQWVFADWFVPIGLDWCHGVEQELAALNPGTTFFFDLGFIKPTVQNLEELYALQMGESSNNQLVFKTSVIDPESSRYKLSEGRHLLHIQASGENSQPVDATFEFNLASGWTENTETLIAEKKTFLSLQ